MNWAAMTGVSMADSTVYQWVLWKVVNLAAKTVSSKVYQWASQKGMNWVAKMGL